MDITIKTKDMIKGIIIGLVMATLITFAFSMGDGEAVTTLNRNGSLNIVQGTVFYTDSDYTISEYEARAMYQLGKTYEIVYSTWNE